MSSGKILAVDDDRNLIELIRMRLESANHEVVTALKDDEAVSAVREQVFDLSIIDLKLADRDGISLMEELHSINPEMPVIILTAHGSIESAVEAMKRGAYSYLTKPFDQRELLLQIERALENRRLTSEIKRLKGLLEERYDFANIVAKSDKMRRVLDVVSRIAKTDSTVYIYGESGTGKELVAKALHLASDRKDKTFVAINCAAVPETLLESELFGHEKGAFTDAVKSKRGLFTQAHEGTIFLDEIGDMPIALQPKLLRVLQERQFFPIGSEKAMDVDVRVIVATKKNLEEEVGKGIFREDLFYRIHVIPIHLPALRERKEDILPLVEHFLKKFCQQMKKQVKGFTPTAMQKLMLYSWPGNVRELENVIEYGVAMTQQDVIGEDLILTTKGTTLETLPISSPEEVKPFKEARDDFERNYLIRLLEISDGNVTRAAKLAGKYRADFYDLLKKHDLKVEDFKKAQ
ncbi:MAG: sigma-54-dependent Fis family transcriptional regulator [Deltaproteobacteria bacterium]|nr:sigma-54-dependent Fis family transcriptional regulator [Deltaproteobacteria bacterium]